MKVEMEVEVEPYLGMDLKMDSDMDIIHFV